jgi:hypothetical protein
VGVKREGDEMWDRGFMMIPLFYFNVLTFSNPDALLGLPASDFTLEDVSMECPWRKNDC